MAVSKWREVHRSGPPVSFWTLVFQWILHTWIVIWFWFLGMYDHRLEKESGIYFNLKYFEELLLDGKFDEAESYLSGFTKLEDNKHSTKIFFEIRKQKYLEALDRYELFFSFPGLQWGLKERKYWVFIFLCCSLDVNNLVFKMKR